MDTYTPAPDGQDGQTRFAKRPAIVQAVPWQGGNLAEVSALGEQDTFAHRGNLLFVRTLEGEALVPKGHVVIRGVRGECYPCAPDIFASLYEVVPSPAPEMSPGILRPAGLVDPEVAAPTSKPTPEGPGELALA